MFGQRIYPNKLGQLRLPEGGYGRDLTGRWWVRPPRGDMGDLEDFTVTEHEDGTISVSPSMDGVDCGQGHWDLKRGRWSSLIPGVQSELEAADDETMELLERTRRNRSP